MAEVTMTPAAAQEFDTLPRTIKSRVVGIIGRLAKWPEVSGAKPLKHALAGRHRIRTGDYRIQFYPDGPNVVIERIGHRDGFYDE